MKTALVRRQPLWGQGEGLTEIIILFPLAGGKEGLEALGSVRRCWVEIPSPSCKRTVAGTPAEVTPKLPDVREAARLHPEAWTEPEKPRKGRDKYSPTGGGRVCLSNAVWSEALDLARSHGWEPAGTLPPGLPEGIDPSVTDWAGGYCTSDYQVIAAADGAAMANALEQAVRSTADAPAWALDNRLLNLYRDVVRILRSGRVSIA